MENADKRKPVSLSELLLFEKAYWTKMCEIEKQSILRNKIEYFLDSIPQDKDNSQVLWVKQDYVMTNKKLQIGCSFERDTIRWLYIID